MAKQEFITLWHGTSDVNLASIKRKGLQPNAGKGGDTWARKNWPGFTPKGGWRKGNVFVTETEGDAMYFSHIATEVNGGEPITLKFRVPLKEFDAHFVPDEADEALGGRHVKWRTREGVPAKYLAGVHNVKGRTIYSTEGLTVV